MSLHVRPLPFKPSRLKGLAPRLIASLRWMEVTDERHANPAGAG